MKKHKGPDSRSYVGTTVPNSIFTEIERLSGESQLRRAQVARALIIRGLAAYYRDGKMSNDLDRQLVEERNLIALTADDCVALQNALVRVC